MFEIPKSDIVCLNKVNDDSIQLVMFVLPGIEGNCDIFATLAKRLETKNVRVYGLEFSLNAPVQSVEASSRHYLGLIRQELKTLNRHTFYLAAYSFGGMYAIEICHQLRTNPTSDFDIRVDKMILFETSHLFFRRSVHVNALQYDTCLHHHLSILSNQAIYTGSLAIYLGFMIGHSNKEFRIRLYQYLLDKGVTDLDDSIEKSFQFVAENKLYEFKSESELDTMKKYLRQLMIKSDSGLKYEHEKTNKSKLNMPVLLIKSRNYMYKNAGELFYLDESDQKQKFDCNEHDFNLSKIVENKSHLQVIECQRGNHWNFINDQVDFIFSVLCNFMFSSNHALLAKL